MGWDGQGSNKVQGLGYEKAANDRNEKKACGTRVEGMEYDFLQGMWRKHNRTSLFQFYFKTTILSGSQVSTPLNSNWLYKFFTPLDCVTVLYFKTCFSCGQQKVNKKEQYSSKCIFGLELITLLEYICTKLFLVLFYGHT